MCSFILHGMNVLIRAATPATQIKLEIRKIYVSQLDIIEQDLFLYEGCNAKIWQKQEILKCQPCVGLTQIIIN